MNNETLLPLRKLSTLVGRSLHTLRKWIRDGMPFERAAVLNPRETGAVLVDINVAREWVARDDRTTASGGAQRKQCEDRQRDMIPCLLEAMADGSTLHDACVSVGIHPNTAKGWIRRGGSTDVTVLRSAKETANQRAADVVRSKMDQFLDHYRSGMDTAEALAACGLSRYQVNNWKNLKRYPQLAAWFSAEMHKASAPRQKPPRNPRLGCVYFLQGVTGGCIKIGFTMYDPRRRMADLQTGSPVVLRIIHTVDAPRSAERWAHARFSGSHSHGEWFRPTVDLLDFIAQGGALHDQNQQELALMRA
jgi:phage terminase Nu1 subunit (DNA packaging protein)